jgi:FkbM family methyltransferase
MNPKTVASRILSRSPLQYIPVRVKGGLAKGAKWTLLPYSSYWRGHTEMDVEAAIKAHGSIEGATCWDLGAHYGIYTVGMARMVGESGQIVAFEPDKLSFSRLSRHVRMNNLSWVKLYNVAVSNKQGTDKLLRIYGAGESTSHLAYDNETVDPQTETLEVTTVTLDELVKSENLRLPDFIKVDVEGHGAKALEGARESLRQAHPTILMSFHSNAELENTHEILEPLGYRSYDIEGKRTEWEGGHYTKILRAS